MGSTDGAKNVLCRLLSFTITSTRIIPYGYTPYATYVWYEYCCAIQQTAVRVLLLSWVLNHVIVRAYEIPKHVCT